MPAGDGESAPGGLGRGAVQGRARCTSVPLYAASCKARDASRRYRLRLRDTSNLRVGGSNPYNFHSRAFIASTTCWGATCAR